jgi:hypothetical protein
MKKQMIIQKERLTRGRKLTIYSHKGFDYDGAAGHDAIAFENMSNRI